MSCKLPPPGWFCSRPSGHPGPCAARPTNPKPRIERLGDFTVADLAAGIRDGMRGEIERLRAALTISRGQWIHSVHARQCLEALGETPAVQP